MTWKRIESYFVICCALLMALIWVKTVPAATSYIYQKPLLENPTAAARFYIYDPVTNSDRNITWGMLSGLLLPAAPTWADITGKPATFTPESHSQAISTITGLQTALDGKEQAGTASAAITGHEAARNHPDSTSTLPEGTNLYFTTARAAAAAPVQSVAGRTGAITLSTADVAGYIAPVNADWNAIIGQAMILNRPAETCSGRISWDGIDGTKFFFGSGAPLAGTGVLNDFSIDSANMNFYRKEGDPPAWLLKGNLIGPPNVMSIGTVTTLPYGQSATATITGSSPSQALSLAIPQGAPGEAATLTRDGITTQLATPNDTVVTLRPVTAGAGGLIIRDSGNNVSVVIGSNGTITAYTAAGAKSFEYALASGLTTYGTPITVRNAATAIQAMINANGTITTYNSGGFASTKLDTSGGIYSYKSNGAAALAYTPTGGLVLY